MLLIRYELKDQSKPYNLAVGKWLLVVSEGVKWQSMLAKVDSKTVEVIKNLVLEKALSEKVSFASLRIEETRTQYLQLRDNDLETDDDVCEFGMSVSVVKNNSFGFAGSVFITPASAEELIKQALELAAISSGAIDGNYDFDGTSYVDLEYSSPCDINPFSVPKRDKIESLREYSSRLLGKKSIDHVTSSFYAAEENKFYADIFGTTALQKRVRIHPVFEAVAILEDGGDYESLRTNAPPVAGGYEYLGNKIWNFDDEIAKIPDLLEEKIKSPFVEEGNYDLVIDPTNLWLTIHESIGHATELDRAIGYEAAYAGTSFATPSLLGKLQYGSNIMNIKADRDSLFGLASIAIDDEGVKTHSFDIVRDGILVGFQTNRSVAGLLGAKSNGCAYGDSPLHVPIQRMANVSLQPSGSVVTTEDLISQVENGFYIVGDRSWSIDMQRYNFQFTGQLFYKIQSGKIVGQVRHAAYQKSTVEFWNSLSALGGDRTYLLAGALNCGKGQPGQVAPVSHGSPSALFENVRVLKV